MAGPLSVDQMEELFKPAPFGETGHVSLFTATTQPEHAGVWDSFRTICPDKQVRPFPPHPQMYGPPAAPRPPVTH